MSRHLKRQPPRPFDSATLCKAMGQAVKTRRQALGWSQATLGRGVGCSRNTISLLEQGKGWPEAPRLLHICLLLDLPCLPRPADAPSLLQQTMQLLSRLSEAQQQAIYRLIQDGFLPAPERGRSAPSPACLPGTEEVS